MNEILGAGKLIPNTNTILEFLEQFLKFQTLVGLTVMAKEFSAT